jgi:pre-mycofactocin synthase
MASKWFESVAVAQRRAESRLPKSVYAALIGGSEKGLSSRTIWSPSTSWASRRTSRELAANAHGDDRHGTVDLDAGVDLAHRRSGGAPRRRGGGGPCRRRSRRRDGTQFLRQPLPRRRLRRELPGALPDVLVGGPRHDGPAPHESEEAGAKGIILTLDWSFSNGRDWGSPWIPEKIDCQGGRQTRAGGACEAAWFWSYARTGHMPGLLTPNMAKPGRETADVLRCLLRVDAEPVAQLGRRRVAALQWDGPFMVKGVSRVDDAKRVVDLGASALSVSNHGGNNLDGTPAPIRSLPAVVDAVGDQIEVLLDGGVRRGSDVVKALALGANAVMIGRAYAVGTRGERSGGGRERARHPARGNRLDAPGTRQVDASTSTADVVAPQISTARWVVNRVAIVTGAARGIGAASVDALVNDGYRVVAVDRCRDIPEVPYALATPAELDAVVARHGDVVLGLVGDVRSATDMQLAVETATRHFGRLDAVVACAGVVAGGRTALGVSDAAWDAVWSVNVLGTRRLIEAAAPTLIANGVAAHSRDRRGRVRGRHHGSSTPRLLQRGEARGGRTHPRGGDGPRALRRHGQRGQSRVDADGDPRGVGRGLRPRQRRRVRGAAQPIGRLIEPSEVAAAITWLCSPAARRPSPAPISPWTAA